MQVGFRHSSIETGVFGWVQTDVVNWCHVVPPACVSWNADQLIFALLKWKSRHGVKMNLKSNSRVNSHVTWAGIHRPLAIAFLRFDWYRDRTLLALVILNTHLHRGLTKSFSCWSCKRVQFVSRLQSECVLLFFKLIAAGDSRHFLLLLELFQTLRAFVSRFDGSPLPSILHIESIGFNPEPAINSPNGLTRQQADRIFHCCRPVNNK